MDRIKAQDDVLKSDDGFIEAIPTNENVVEVIQEVEYYKVNYFPNVIYGTVGDSSLKLQLFVPDPKELVDTVFPCILFIKGSGWKEQDLYGIIPEVSQFARRGYVIAIVEYRSSSEAIFPAQRTDALMAYDFLKAHAADYKIDSTNMYVWGDSSGGHIALFVGLSVDHGGVPDVNGIIAYYPPSNLLITSDAPYSEAMGGAESSSGLLMGGKAVWEDPTTAKYISPYYYITAEAMMPPIFLAHGTKDRVVPFSQSDMFANRLEEYGKVYEFYALRNADHGSWEFWTDAMLDRVEAFILKYKR